MNCEDFLASERGHDVESLREYIRYMSRQKWTKRCKVAAELAQGYATVLNYNYAADEFETDEEDLYVFVMNNLIHAENNAVGTMRLWFDAASMKRLFETSSDMARRVLDYFEDIDCGMRVAYEECRDDVDDFVHEYMRDM